MTPGTHRARAAEYSFSAFRLLAAAQQEAEHGGLEVDAGDILEGVGILADQLLDAADEYGRLEVHSVARFAGRPERRRATA